MAQNKMGVVKLNKLIWSMGIPMVFSMILQAIYNVVDTIFVVNKAELGQAANQALTFAFPVQILLIAVGVGTGVGLNALLSKYLGEGKKEEASKAAGVGIFIGIVVEGLFFIWNPYNVFPKKSFKSSRFLESEDAICAIICLYRSFQALIGTKVVSVGSRIVYVEERLSGGKPVMFHSLFTACKSRSEIVATFLAVLELLRNGRIDMEDDGDDIALELIEE